MRFGLSVVLALLPVQLFAQSALVDGARAVLANPAALGILPGWELEVGFVDFDLRQYNDYITSLSEIESMLGPGKRFADLSASEQAKALELLQGFAGDVPASAVAGRGFVLGKFRNFGLGLVARSRGSAELTLDEGHLTAPQLSANQSTLDGATLSALELRLAYSHSLLPHAEHSQLYAGAALRILEGRVSAFHGKVQELGDPGRPLQPRIFTSLSGGKWNADLDLGIVYAYRTFARAGLSLEGAVDPHFEAPAVEGYLGPRKLSFGRQLTLGVGLTPGGGLSLGGDLALTKRPSSLDKVAERMAGVWAGKDWGGDWSTRLGLGANLAASTGLTASLGLGWKALEGELLYSPRAGLFTQDQLGFKLGLRLHRLSRQKNGDSLWMEDATSTQE